MVVTEYNTVQQSWKYIPSIDFEAADSCPVEMGGGGYSQGHVHEVLDVHVRRFSAS